MTEAGIQNIISMQQIDINNQLGKDKIKKIELASMIKRAPAPYEKTKILRIVQRYYLKNKLPQSIVFKEPYSDKSRVIHPDCEKNYSFLNSNSRNSLAIRLADPDETQGIPQGPEGQDAQNKSK